jgi:molecular chaperone DnaK (HSP70)
MGKGDKLQIVSEPEAAAVYALDAMDPHDIKIGDTFVLCDAGGGTVDLISYTVTALKPILKIEEAAPGTGGLCGSTYLNRIFKEFITTKLGNNEQWDEEVLEDALKRFELVTKRAFTGNPTEKFTIPVPGLLDDPDQGVRRGKFTIQGSDIVNIFAPVLREIIALVKGQIKATKRKVRAVLLVGGFGQSVYLRDQIRAAVGSSVEVLAPPNGYVKSTCLL